jgi:hypothetical protein
MALEVGTFISDLIATNPTSTDPKAEGDDHIRLLKSTVKATFPNVTGSVLPTHTELNFVDGVTSAIQTQLNGKAPLNSPALTGTPTAPTASPGDSSTQIATTAFVVSQAFSSALPGQTGNAGRFLGTNGTIASWENAVSSVAMSVPSFLSVSGTPITSSGTLAVTLSGTALPVANGGTGVTTSTGSGANVLNTSPAISAAELTGATYTNGSARSNIVAVAALDINCSLGNYFTKTISGNSTFTVSNVPTDRAYAFTLELTHTSGTVTWFANVQWPNQTAPTLTTGRTHLFTFVTDSGTSRWRGVANVNYTT